MTIRTREDIRLARLEAGYPDVYAAFPADTIDEPRLREAWTRASARYAALLPAMGAVRTSLRRPDWPGSEGQLESNAGLRGALASADDDLFYLLTNGPESYEIPDPVVADAWAKAIKLARRFEASDRGVRRIVG